MQGKKQSQKNKSVPFFLDKGDKYQKYSFIQEIFIINKYYTIYTENLVG